jgi:endonuclease YncB( thermonuclease family)
MTNPEIIRFRYPLTRFHEEIKGVEEGKLYRVKDGDTVQVCLDRGFDNAPKVTGLRINGIDAPEKSTRKNLLEREAGGLVKRVAEKWIAEQASTGDQFFASSDKLSKYANRTIGRLWCGEIGRELGGFLLAGGFVRAYTGKKREAWTAAELDPIIENSKVYLGIS